MKTVEDLNQILNKLGSEYPILETRAKSHSKREEFFDEMYYNILPLSIERSGEKKGRRIQNSKNAVFEYYFDENEKIIKVIEHQGQALQETFLEWCESGVCIYKFKSFKGDVEPVSVTWVDYKEGKAIHTLLVAEDAFIEEKYVYEDHLLRRISSVNQNPWNPLIKTEFSIVYDPHLNKIYRSINDGPQNLIYEVNEEQIDIDDFIELLTNWTIDVIQNYQSQTLLYCLALNYGHGPSTAFPPVFGFGQVYQLEEWKKMYKARELLKIALNPAEFEIFEIPELLRKNKNVMEPCEKINRWLPKQKKPISIVRNILIKACEKVNACDFSKNQNISPQFFCYPVDDDLVDLNKNLKALGINPKLI